MIEPSPATKKLDPTKPLTPGDLARLQNDRAVARKWLDSCEVDVLDLETRLAAAVEERARAADAYRVADDEVQRWRKPPELREPR